MFRARMGVAAQSLGISQAAYEEALKYAKERRQFGKPIYDIPVVSNMLIEMRVLLESNRSLFYSVAKCVDQKEKLEDRIESLKSAGQPFTEENTRLKQLTKLANLLTPVTKYILAESANKISYDALQIHGGTGYMKEFRVERLARDARITNIYEGTSQMQIVAASGGVINDVLEELFNEKEQERIQRRINQACQSSERNPADIFAQFEICYGQKGKQLSGCCRKRPSGNVQFPLHRLPVAR